MGKTTEMVDVCTTEQEEALRLKRRLDYLKHKESRLAIIKNYQELHKDKISVYNKEYYQQNKDRISRYKKEWYKNRIKKYKPGE